MKKSIKLFIEKNIVDNYEDFVELLKEGLIRTHDMTLNQSTLSINLESCGIKHRINIFDKFSFEIIIYNLYGDGNKLDKIDIVKRYTENVYGYFPSYFWVKLNNGMQNDFKYNEELFNFEISKSLLKELKIRFEAKYDDGLYKNTHKIPDVLYHLSPDNILHKIKRDGLIPKNKNRKTTHPGRIYLFKNLSETDVLLKMIKLNDSKDKVSNITYSLIELDLKNKKDIVLHTDPNYLNGFFIYDNIAPHYLKILKSEL